MSLSIGIQDKVYATSINVSSKVFNFSKVILEALNKKDHNVQPSNLSKIEYWYNTAYKLNDSKFDLLKNEVENTVKFNTDAVLEFIHTTWGLTDYHLIDSVKDISPDIILTHITELGGHDQSNPINYSDIRTSWVSFIENLKDGSLFQSKPFRLAQELKIIKYFESKLTFYGQLKKGHLNRYAYMVGSADLREQFKSGSNSSVSSSISSHGSPDLYRGRTHLATLTSSSHAESDSLLNIKQLVQAKDFSPSDTEDSQNTTYDDSFGLQSPGSPVTHHEGPHTTNGKRVAFTDPNSPLGVIEAGFNAEQPGNDNALNSIPLQQTGVLGQFHTEVDTITDTKGSEIQDSSPIDIEAGLNGAQDDGARLLNGMPIDQVGLIGQVHVGASAFANRVYGVSLGSFCDSDNSFSINNGAVKRLLDDQSENSSQGSDQSFDSDNGKNRINKMLLLKCMCLSSSILSLIWLYYFVFFREKP